MKKQLGLAGLWVVPGCWEGIDTRWISLRTPSWNGQARTLAPTRLLWDPVQATEEFVGLFPVLPASHCGVHPEQIPAPPQVSSPYLL